MVKTIFEMASRRNDAANRMRAGLGASHQTGWTELMAKIIQLYGLLDSKRVLEAGKSAAFVKSASAGAEAKT